MGKPAVSKYHRYCFEMEMEINSALTFSAGELCALLTDGLFALDDMGTLFPGVKSPGVGERLTSIRMGASGYMKALQRRPKCLSAVDVRTKAAAYRQS